MFRPNRKSLFPTQSHRIQPGGDMKPYLVSTDKQYGTEKKSLDIADEKCALFSMRQLFLDSSKDIFLVLSLLGIISYMWAKNQLFSTENGPPSGHPDSTRRITKLSKV
jgi:hypothetical protein